MFLFSKVLLLLVRLRSSCVATMHHYCEAILFILINIHSCFPPRFKSEIAPGKHTILVERVNEAINCKASHFILIIPPFSFLGMHLVIIKRKAETEDLGLML